MIIKCLRCGGRVMADSEVPDEVVCVLCARRWTIKKKEEAYAVPG